MIYPLPANVPEGLAVRLSTSLTAGYRSCGPVHFVLTVAPSGVYFQQNPGWAAYRAGGPAPDVRFAVTVDTGAADTRDLHNVAFSLDTSQLSGTYDRDNRYQPFPMDVFTDPDKMRAIVDRYVTVDPPDDLDFSETGDGNLITYTGSVHNWQSITAPLQMSFDADWAGRRSLGSCYVALPSLIGDDFGALAQSTFAIERLTGSTALTTENNTTNSGETDVDLPSGGLSIDPRSDAAATADGRTWTCVNTSTNVETSNRGSCDGLVITQATSAATVQNLAVFIAAALFSLSLQIAYETAKRQRTTRRRRMPRSRRTA